ncbi:hypothetical protein CR513_20646, partial [Mucuna pruriens]
MLEMKLLGFYSLKDLYVDDNNFKEAYDYCAILANGEKKCVPKSSIRELLVKEAHKKCLIGHFGVYKTYKALFENFYYLKIIHDMHHVCESV